MNAGSTEVGGTEVSLTWRNVAGAILLVLLLFSVALSVKVLSYWPVLAFLPLAVAAYAAVLRFAPRVYLSASQVSRRRLASMLFLCFLVFLLLVALGAHGS